MKIISVFGNSGSGKGTVATILCMMDDRLHHSKFARPMKRELEQEYDLPEQFLEHRLMKQQMCGKRSTYLDVMVRLYHEREHLTDLPRDTRHLLSQCQQYGLIPLFDDCRNQREASVLEANDTFGIWVNGRGEALSTDAQQWDIWRSCRFRNHLHNSGDRVELMRRVLDLYEDVVKFWLG